MSSVIIYLAISLLVFIFLQFKINEVIKSIFVSYPSFELEIIDFFKEVRDFIIKANQDQ